MSDSELVERTGLRSIVSKPTRGHSKLDRVYVSDLDYSGVKVIKSVAKSDHMAIVAYTGEMKTAVCKTRGDCTFKKHTAAQHARFLASGTSPVHVVNQNGDPQEEFDKFYTALLQLMDEYYPERSVTITSGDPAYVTSAVKHNATAEKQTDAIWARGEGSSSSGQDRNIN